MPVIKSAKKKLRKDKKRTLGNREVKKTYKELLKRALQKPQPVALSQATQAIDKAAKKHIIHKNKAARLKSRLAKQVAQTKPKKKARIASKKSPVVSP